jgi:hypothetical protein
MSICGMALEEYERLREMYICKKIFSNEGCYGFYFGNRLSDAIHSIQIFRT